MLFNSAEFIVGFLPLAILGFAVASRVGGAPGALGFVVVASLVFYGWSNPLFVPLLLASMAFNYGFSLLLRRGDRSRAQRRTWLAVGVAANLAVLGYFKYAGLPIIGLSFFTFQQIAFLVDVHRGTAGVPGVLRYAFFVAFFPQLIAGPIVRHRDVLPQVLTAGTWGLRARNVAIGLTIFVIGLVKKVVVADSIGYYADPVFAAAAQGIRLTFFEAWGGALAYSFQIYFDFSAYSDMAIGLGRVFGIRLPINFHSPYKADNITDFWRRWHITLSQWIRDYVFLPGGRLLFNTPFRSWPEAAAVVTYLATFLVVGVWHGVGWTFVIWGALHGSYLLVHRWWQLARGDAEAYGLFGRWGSRALTLTAVMVAWVFFRAADVPSALSVLRSMSGVDGVRLDYLFTNELLNWNEFPYWVVALSAIVLLAPNTQQILRRYRPGLPTYPVGLVAVPLPFLRWRPSPAWSVATALLMVAALSQLEQVTRFIYFQF